MIQSHYFFKEIELEMDAKYLLYILFKIKFIVVTVVNNIT